MEPIITLPRLLLAVFRLQGFSIRIPNENTATGWIVKARGNTKNSLVHSEEPIFTN
jgi:hypothetical protein